MTAKELGRAFDTAWVAIALLQLADVVSTTAALRLSIGHENNPLMVGIVQHPWLMLLAKVAVVGLGWMVLRLGAMQGRGTLYSPLSWIGSAVILAWYVAVLVNNSHVLIS